MDGQYTVRVNGADLELDEPMNLRTLLEREGYDLGRVAVEKNGKIVPKAKFGDEPLTGGDRLEIVTFVGGG